MGSWADYVALVALLFAAYVCGWAVLTVHRWRGRGPAWTPAMERRARHLLRRTVR